MKWEMLTKHNKKLPEVISLGEILVEIMRKQRDVPHNIPGIYLGPYPSGAPAIFIDSVARLGVSAGFIGVVGKDDFGQMLRDRLAMDGVDTKHIRISSDHTTGTTFVMYYSSGERKFIFHLRHAAAGQLNPKDIDPNYFSNAKVLHISGSSLAISESSKEACYKAVNIARKREVKITFDPNLRPELINVGYIREICRPVLTVSDVVLPSKTEIEVLTGISDPIEAAKEIIKIGPKLVIVKLGGEGSIAVTKVSEIVKAPAFHINEVDPTGAGDVFDAAFVVGMLKGWPLQKILEFANAAGAIKVTKFGPMEGPENINEVLEFIRLNEYSKKEDFKNK